MVYFLSCLILSKNMKNMQIKMLLGGLGCSHLILSFASHFSTQSGEKRSDWSGTEAGKVQCKLQETPV